MEERQGGGRLAGGELNMRKTCFGEGRPWGREENIRHRETRREEDSRERGSYLLAVGQGR